MAIPAYFSQKDLGRLGETLLGKEMVRAEDLISGDPEAWRRELLNLQPIFERLRAQHERGLEGLSSAYRQAGVTGPAAALGLERAEQGPGSYGSSLMNIANQMRGMGHQEAWKGGEIGEQIKQHMQNLAAQRKARHAAEKQARRAQIAQYAKMAAMVAAGALAGPAGSPAGLAGTGGMQAYIPSAGSVSTPVDIWSQYSGWTPK